MQSKEYRRQYYLKNKKHTLAVNKLWAKNNIEKKDLFGELIIIKIIKN